MVAEFECRPEVDVVYGHAALVNGSGRVLHALWVPPFNGRLLRRTNFLIQPAVFIRRSAIGDTLVDEEFHFSMDRELWLRLLASGGRFRRIDRILAIDRHWAGRKSDNIPAADQLELERRYQVPRRTAANAVLVKAFTVSRRVAGARPAGTLASAPLAFEGCQDGRPGSCGGEFLSTRAGMPADECVEHGESSSLIDQVDRVAEGEAPVWSTGQSWEQRLKAVAHLLGMEVSRWRPPERRLAEYLETHDIRNVLDVGANGGQFGQMLRAAGLRGRIVSFEPLRKPFEVLSRAAAPDLMWEVHRLALGDAPGRRVMNVSTNTTSSSFLDIERAHTDALAAARFVASEEVDVARLDEVAESLRLAGQTLLKLDVQGYHLAVLRGAAGMLDAVTAIQCECLDSSSLRGWAPVLLDVLAELRESGFELTELEPGFYDPRTGRILQFDGRFSRPSAGKSPLPSGRLR